MKKKLLLVTLFSALLTLLTGCQIVLKNETRLIASQECTDIILENSFKIETPAFALTEYYEVKNLQNQKVAKIDRKAGLATNFEYLNQNGKIVFSSREKIFSRGVQIDVTDCNQIKMGTILENLEKKSMFSSTSYYDILDQNDNIILTSERRDVASPTITLKDTSGVVVAEMKMGNFPGRWSVEIKDLIKANPKIVLTILGHKIFADLKKQ